MKKLLRVIFYIPKLLLRFIWNLIWAIFKLALILAIVGYGLIYYANNSSSTLATNINRAFRQVELGFSGTNTSDVEKVVSNWNKTGAFIFTLTDDASTADIVATDYSDANSQAAGLADSQTNVLTNRITHVDVKLNRYFLLNSDFGYTHKRIVNTAEHELGHAIGLDHDGSKTSVMQSAGSYYGIQQVDIDTVHALYAN